MPFTLSYNKLFFKLSSFYKFTKVINFSESMYEGACVLLYSEPDENSRGIEDSAGDAGDTIFGGLVW
jgi:NADPH-dependent glutamate synthase beta subunit-like oxidoreductase